jgi:hypothetical protein
MRHFRLSETGFFIPPRPLRAGRDEESPSPVQTSPSLEVLQLILVLTGSSKMHRVSAFQLVRWVLLPALVVAAPLIGRTQSLTGDSETVTKDEPQPRLPPTPENICQAIATSAAAHDLPVTFFTRLIWQESRFNPEAVSRAGAQGVAQFMPATAKLRGLADPFDPFEAIEKSAQLLRDLNQEFGNLGLAAAAYNAGPGRVRDWLTRRRPLPGETRAYVLIVTGLRAEEWIGGPKENYDFPPASNTPCGETGATPGSPVSPAPPPPKPEPVKPWGVELAGGPTQVKAMAKYRELLLKYSAGSIIANREPRVVVRGLIGEMAAARVRIDVETREEGLKLCTALQARGWFCDVLRNLDRRPLR